MQVTVTLAQGIARVVALAECRRLSQGAGPLRVLEHYELLPMDRPTGSTLALDEFTRTHLDRAVMIAVEGAQMLADALGPPDGHINDPDVLMASVLRSDFRDSAVGRSLAVALAVASAGARLKDEDYEASAVVADMLARHTALLDRALLAERTRALQSVSGAALDELGAEGDIVASLLASDLGALPLEAMGSLESGESARDRFEAGRRAHYITLANHRPEMLRRLGRERLAVEHALGQRSARRDPRDDRPARGTAPRGGGNAAGTLIA